MVIDARKEKLLTLKELARQLGLSYNTIDRMIKEGKRSVGGEVVTLEAILTTSGRKTSLEAYYRFIGKINEC